MNIRTFEMLVSLKEEIKKLESTRRDFLVKLTFESDEEYRLTIEFINSIDELLQFKYSEFQKYVESEDLGLTIQGGIGN